MNADMLSGVVRAGVAALGGYLVSKGKLSVEDFNTIMGAATTLFVAGWSIFAKRNK